MDLQAGLPSFDLPRPADQMHAGLALLAQLPS